MKLFNFLSTTTAAFLLIMGACIMPTAEAFGIRSNIWQSQQRKNSNAPLTTAPPTNSRTFTASGNKGIKTLANNRMLTNVRHYRHNSDSSSSQRLFMAANADFPTFDGDVFHRPSDDFVLEVGHGALKYFDNDDATKAYVEAIYGYGTSSFPERNTPAAVIYAKNKKDIINAVEYAYKTDISVAIRSGGHQYGAYCAAIKKNIVIDLSDPEADFNRDIAYNDEDLTWTVGAGVKLETLIKELKGRGAFVPHGECTWVRCGGHLHTGGYSPFFSRSFGMFVDHITEFTIVLAPSSKTNFQAQAKTVKKPLENNPSDDDDLWFAVMGGSPGHFGVVTDMTIKPRWDKDHENARAMIRFGVYDKAKFKTAIEILTEYCDDDNLPADYDFNVFVIQSRDKTTEENEGRQNLDTCVRDSRPEIYGPKPDYSPPIYALVVNWNHVSGVGFDETDKDGYNAAEIFEKIRERLPFPKPNKPVASLLMELGVEPNQKTVGSRPPEIFGLNGNQDMTISELDRILGFAARIDANPYFGTDRLYLPGEGGSKLKATNFIDGTVNTLDAAYSDDCWPTPQWGTTGGKHSQIRKNKAANPNIALSHRDAAMNCIYYVHYDNVKDGKDQDGPAKAAKKNVEDMEKVLVDAFGGDHRWFAFCGQDETLDELWPYYFDSEADYNRVKKVKTDYDPKNVFTPHKYGVSSD